MAEVTADQCRAYTEAYAKALEAWNDAMQIMLHGEPRPPEVTAVAEVLGLDPGELDWHVEAEHGWEPHDEGYGFTYTWDWFWKPDSHGGGGSG
jgi:hypothetical protein